MAIDPRDPDASLVVLFCNRPKKNETKSIEAGRPIFDDEEICEIRFAGRRDWQPFPATAMSHWAIDPDTGGQVRVTYAERFPKQYRQFKEHAAQTKSGTPLAHAPFLTDARRAELRALNIYTVEALASIDGQDLKNLGQGGRDMKNSAQEFISDSKLKAPSLQLQQEMEVLRAQNQVLQEDLAAAKKALPQNGSAEFEEMSDEQLRDFIRVHSGHTPQGNLPRKSLVRMATDVRPHRAA